MIWVKTLLAKLEEYVPNVSNVKQTLVLATGGIGSPDSPRLGIFSEIIVILEN